MSSEHFHPENPDIRRALSGTHFTSLASRVYSAKESSVLRVNRISLFFFLSISSRFTSDTAATLARAMHAVITNNAGQLDGPDLAGP